MNIAKSSSLARIFITVAFELSSNIEEEIKITRWNGKNAMFIKDQRYDHDEAMYFNILLDILTTIVPDER